MRAVLLALGLLASAPALAAKTRGCGDPESDGRRLSDGRDATRSVVAILPGYDVMFPVTRGMTLQTGAICRVQGRRELTGADALHAALEATDDPYVLAVVAMAVLEPGVGGKAPWRPGDAGSPPAADPPSLVGGHLAYWRAPPQQGGWVHVDVDTSTGAVVSELAADGPAGAQ